MHKLTPLSPPQAIQHARRNEPEPQQPPQPSRPLQPADPDNRSTNPIDPLLAGLPPRKRFAAAWALSTQAGDSARHESLGTLVAWVRASQWNSEAGDMAPQLITRLPQWPAGRGLEVHDRESGRIYAFGDTRPGQAPVQVLREREHYSALVNGRCVPVPGDGNCFFHAVARALGGPDHESSAALRLGLARYIEENPEEVAPWTVTPRRAGMSSSDASKPLARVSPLPSTGVGRASGVPSVRKGLSKADELERTAIALQELMEMAERNRHLRPDQPPLDAQQIRQSALAHGLEADALEPKVRHEGKLTLLGYSSLQQWRMNKDRAAYNRVDEKILGELQSLARNPAHPVLLTDDFIVRIALDRKLSIHRLRSCIGVWGDLKIHQSLEAAQGKKSIRVTAAALEHIQRDLAAGIPLTKACENRNLSFNYVKQLVRARTGTLSILGQNMQHVAQLARDGFVQAHVTADALVELKTLTSNGRLSDAQIFDFSKEKNMPFITLKGFFLRNGEYSESGKRFLERSRGQEEETTRQDTVRGEAPGSASDS